MSRAASAPDRRVMGATPPAFRVYDWRLACYLRDLASVAMLYGRNAAMVNERFFFDLLFVPPSPASPPSSARPACGPNTDHASG